jgi:hypothetical protein
MNEHKAWSIYKKFEVFVIILVTLIGGGFGAFAGCMYGRSTFGMIVNIVIGATLGITGGFMVSKLYLKWLVKIFIVKSKPFISWLLATLVAAICGVLCTTFIHAILTIILLIVSDIPLIKQLNGFWLIIIGIAEIIGAGAGFAAGALCTSLYMWKIHSSEIKTVEIIMEKNETNELS